MHRHGPDHAQDGEAARQEARRVHDHEDRDLLDGESKPPVA